LLSDGKSSDGEDRSIKFASIDEWFETPVESMEEGAHKLA
jgi:hypothetical protein